jgi:hypothetical protein
MEEINIAGTHWKSNVSTYKNIIHTDIARFQYQGVDAFMFF